MINLIEPSWKAVLSNEFKKPYFKSLQNFISDEMAKYQVFPSKKNIYTAFELTPFDEVKVVIIGQDPYHGEHQANGLCFSVNDTIPHPPSLVNIFKEIHSDLGKPIPESGNLSHWAKQGVLLLNATLTVRMHEAGSHQGKGWEIFTDEVIRLVAKEKENIVFLLWGGFAQKKAKLIDTSKHIILKCGHPSPLSANKGHWFGNKHFSKTNTLLVQFGKSPIIW